MESKAEKPPGSADPPSPAVRRPSMSMNAPTIFSSLTKSHSSTRNGSPTASSAVVDADPLDVLRSPKEGGGSTVRRPSLSIGPPALFTKGPARRHSISTGGAGVVANPNLSDEQRQQDHAAMNAMLNGNVFGGSVAPNDASPRGSTSRQTSHSSLHHLDDTDDDDDDADGDGRPSLESRLDGIESFMRAWRHEQTRSTEKMFSRLNKLEQLVLKRRVAPTGCEGQQPAGAMDGATAESSEKRSGTTVEYDTESGSESEHSSDDESHASRTRDSSESGVSPASVDRAPRPQKVDAEAEQPQQPSVAPSSSQRPSLVSEERPSQLMMEAEGDEEKSEAPATVDASSSETKGLLPPEKPSSAVPPVGRRPSLIQHQNASVRSLPVPRPERTRSQQNSIGVPESEEVDAGSERPHCGSQSRVAPYPTERGDSRPSLQLRSLNRSMSNGEERGNTWQGLARKASAAIVDAPRKGSILLRTLSKNTLLPSADPAPSQAAVSIPPSCDEDESMSTSLAVTKQAQSEESHATAVMLDSTVISELTLNANRYQSFLIPENSEGRSYWDGLIVFLVLYELAMAPLSTSFGRLRLPAAIHVFEDIVYACFCVDLLLNFNTTYYVGEQEIVDRKLIAKRCRSFFCQRSPSPKLCHNSRSRLLA